MYNARKALIDARIDSSYAAYGNPCKFNSVLFGTIRVSNDERCVP